MTDYSATQTYTQAGDWLLGTARRNPEALLLVAAGCCLLMRGASSSSRNSARVRNSEYQQNRDIYRTGSSYQHQQGTEFNLRRAKSFHRPAKPCRAQPIPLANT